MSDLRRMLHDMTHRLLGEQCTTDVQVRAEGGEWPEKLWRQIENAGLTLAVVPESLGGAGATLGDAMVIMQSAGKHAVPLPLVETILGNWLLAQGDAPAAEGPLTIVPVTDRESIVLSHGQRGWTLRGKGVHVPWAGAATNLVAVAHLKNGQQAVVSIPRQVCEIRAALNVAGEPRDEVVFNSISVPSAKISHLSADLDLRAALFHIGALARCHQMTGAMEWVFERCCAYAGERVQFGRPIGNFQAVQHMIAMMAGQMSAASMAANSAVAALGYDGSDDAIGYAKARVGEAAGEVAALAHQVHGAMGYSYEYPLHFRTRRMWAWREEFGSERFWQIRAGRRIASRGGKALWQDLTV